jgi:transposase InsO family protein
MTIQIDFSQRIANILLIFMDDNWETMGVSSPARTTTLLDNVIVDADNTIVNGSADVVIDTDLGISHEERTFYAKIDDFKKGLKFPDKVMLTTAYTDEIKNALKHNKGGKTSGITSKFYGWCKQHFRIDLTSGMELLCSRKNGRRIVVLETYFAVMKNVHEKTGHGARDKMRHEINQHYYWIPSHVVDIFLHCCVSCQLRKSVKAHVAPTAIIAIGFLTRLQMDLVDLRTRPSNNCQWILHCRDHFSKFSWAFALQNKEANGVARCLVDLFYQFGPCRILQSDNGKEFTAQVIKDLKQMWPGLVIINGRPRHPQSQGLVERGNATLCDILGKFMSDRNTSDWTACLLAVVHAMNTSLARSVGTTPYEIVFGQKPRLNCELWKSVEEKGSRMQDPFVVIRHLSLIEGIIDEEDLPSTISEQIRETQDSTDASNDAGNNEQILSPQSQSSNEPISDDFDRSHPPPADVDQESTTVANELVVESSSQEPIALTDLSEDRSATSSMRQIQIM